MNKLTNDTECIAEWQMFLKAFKDINPKSETAAQEYLELKELVKNSVSLTARQNEMLMYRLNNWQEYHTNQLKTVKDGK